MRSKKIAVTGSTGMLGGYIVAELLRRGYTDIVLVVRNRARLENLYKTLEREGVAYSTNMFTIIEVELNNPRELAVALVGVETVFHTAAVVNFRDIAPREIIETNVEITAHVVNAALESGVGLLVHTSSIAALGEMRGGAMIDETTSIDNLAYSSPYGVSKFYCENEVWRGAQRGLRVVVVNPGVIFGVCEWTDSGSAEMVGLISKGLPFYTTGVTGYVDVRDVARAEVLLSECSEAVGERFVLVESNLSFRELLEKGADVAGKRKPYINLSPALMKIASGVSTVFARLTRGAPMATRSVARTANSVSRYDGTKIARYIDFTYTPIETTIREVVGAYINREKKQLKS